MISAKISATTLMFIASVLAVGALTASFDNVQASNVGGAARYPTHAKRTRSADAPIQLCGYRLLEMVRGLCGGFFSGYSRRSDPGMPLNGMLEEVSSLREGSSNSGDLNAENAPQYSNGEAYLDATSEYSDMDPNWNQNSKVLALKFLGEKKAHPRYRRNIIDDCCKRPCTVTHMLKYCGRT